MNQRVLHKFINVILYYWDYYLFPGGTFSHHLNAWLSLGRFFNDAVNSVNFFHADGIKCFFDFDYFSHAVMTLSLSSGCN